MNTQATTAAAMAAAPVPGVEPGTTAGAPGAPAAAKILSLADYTERAVQSMTQTEPAAAGAKPGAEPGKEPSPDLAAAPAAAAADKTKADDGEEPEVPEAEQAAWTDGEKKLYGALKKERDARKAAKAEVKETRAKLEELMSKVTELSKTKEAPKTEEPGARPAGTPGDGLGDCKSFEEVDARVAEAGRIEDLTHDLQEALQRSDRESVNATLAAEKITAINGKAVADCSDREIGDFLSSAYKGSRQTQRAANGRKGFIAASQQSAARIIEMVPALKDESSPEHKRFQEIVARRPGIKALGADWPEQVLTFMLGEGTAKAVVKASAAKTESTTPPTTAAAKPVIVPPVPARATPGAPGKSAAAIPQTSETDKARQKIHGKGATLDDVQALARASLAAP